MRLPKLVEKAHDAVNDAPLADFAFPAAGFGAVVSGDDDDRSHGKNFTACCAAIILLLMAWRPIGPVLWEPGGAVRTVAAAGFVLGFLLAYWATFTLGHTELLGLRQAWRSAVDGAGAGPPPAELRVRGIYTVVRHPLMTALLLCLWCAPALTAGRLLLASTLSAYIVIGTRYEERDLRVTFGPAYGARVEGVPAFAPRLALRRSAR